MSQLKDERVFDVPTDVVAKLTASDRRLIRELTVKLAASHDAALPHPPPPPPDDLRPYIDPWVSFMLYEGKSPETLKTYTYHIRFLLARLPSPTKQELALFVTNHAAKPAATSTIHVELCAFKSFFGYLKHADILAENPAAELKSPHRHQRARKPADPTDVGRLLAHPNVSHRDKTLILLLADCGLRIQEAVTLRLADLDLAAMHVTVFGKGSKERTVPFSHVTLTALQEHISGLRPGASWLFQGFDPDRHLTKDAVARGFRRICDRVEIPRFSPHQLRHYFATSMLNDHANLRVVSQLLGHARPSITANVYWHAVDLDEGRKEHRRHNPLRAILRLQEPR